MRTLAILYKYSTIARLLKTKSKEEIKMQTTNLLEYFKSSGMKLSHTDFFPSADEEHKTQRALKVQKRLEQREREQPYEGFFRPIGIENLELEI